MPFSAWMIALLLAFQQPTLSPDATRLIAPVIVAIETEQTRQAVLPPPVDLNERFLRMYRLDQQSRAALKGIDFTTLPPAERQPAMAAMWSAIGAVDKANETTLLEMIPPEGWF